MSSLRQWFQRLRPKFSVLAGYLFLWIVAGNAFGWIAHFAAIYLFGMPENSLNVDVPIYIPEESANHPVFPEPEHYYCYPQPSIGGFYFKCEYAASSFFWWLSVGIPNMCWYMITITIGFIGAGVWHMNSNWFFEGLLWLLYSIPVLITFYIGMKYWRKKKPLLFKSLAAYLIGITAWEIMKL